ncbi:MAG: OmpA family protein [Flavobacteriales bacterium]|nr:OmpA family protein [Flavobacteriales bacterium]
MPQSITKYISIFMVLIWATGLKGQGVSDYVSLADEWKEKGNYAMAVYFYEQAVISCSKNERSAMHPYTTGKSYYRKTQNIEEYSLILEDDSEFPEQIEYKKPTTEVLNLSSDSVLLVTLESAECSDLVYQLGHAYYMNNEYDRTELLFSKYLTHFKNFELLGRFWYANALIRKSKYVEAIAQLERFRDEIQYASGLGYYYERAKILIGDCNFAFEQLANFEFEKLAYKENNVSQESHTMFGASYSARDTILYISKLVEKNIGEIKHSDLDIVEANLKSKEQTGLGDYINTEIHEASPHLSKNGMKMFFTRWSNDQKPAIYMSNKFNGRWLTPLRLGPEVNKDGYSAINPHYAEDQGRLYFASDRDEGRGKFDIWYVNIDEFGKADSAINLGARINTQEDEVSPFYHAPTKALYFSSDGHPGLGGRDVFVSKRGSKAWGFPENLGYPVNYSKDDEYFILHDDGVSGYLSTNRTQCFEECTGGKCHELYSVNLSNRIVLKGKVKEKETQEPIEDVLVQVFEFGKEEEGNAEFSITNDNGFYELELEAGKNYEINIQKKGYANGFGGINTDYDEVSDELTKNFNLSKEVVVVEEKIKLDDVKGKEEIVLDDILYDYGKAELRASSKERLNILFEFMLNNPSLTVEIAAHTDARGGAKYNLELSQSRAESCVNYLVEQGIARNRLRAKGYGESKLLVKNAKTDAEHQINRRTTFKVLDDSFKGN